MQNHFHFLLLLSHLCFHWMFYLLKLLNIIQMNLGKLRGEKISHSLEALTTYTVQTLRDCKGPWSNRVPARH